jgi:hypothetical protein
MIKPYLICIQET